MDEHTGLEEQPGLDFEAFCALPCNAAKAVPALRRAFDEADIDRSGRVERAEALRYSLIDALGKRQAKLLDWFRLVRRDHDGLSISATFSYDGGRFFSGGLER